MNKAEMIRVKDAKYEYVRRDEDDNVEAIVTAIDGVDLDIEEGEFVAILGHNGSGKSTLAKHLNALLVPEEGTVWVDGKDTKDSSLTMEIRKTAGMVFQNPDNQIIAGIVEEDVGFGPENIGVETKEIWHRVEDCLKKVGMYKYAKHSPNKLSGGQKQRVAIAGVLAMHPKCVVLDEPTAMLDPNGRKEVIRTAIEMNRKGKVTVILITHYMEEVIHADRIYVMDKGKVVMQGTPRSIFSQVDTLRSYRLAVPQVTLLAHELIRRGLPLKEGVLDRAEFVQELSGLIRESQDGDGRAFVPDSTNTFDAKAGAHAVKPEDAVLILDHVSHIYNAGMDTEVQALKEVSLTIGQGEFIGLIGHTGSGKSTLIQHLNGLLKASSGAIYFRGQDIDDKDFKKKELRSQVGLVFQYPEHQLFETTVLDDVCFGPKNLGRSPEEAKDAAFDALEKVGLDPSIYDASPFDLSGGQKRRVAIAGVLAMEPSVLILDEPTAGLDPKGRDDILGQIRQLHEQKKITVILVSHSMEDVADYVDRIIVMNQGEVMFDDEPKHVFQHQKELEAVGLAVPQVTELMGDLRENGIAVHADITTVEEAAEEIMRRCTG